LTTLVPLWFLPSPLAFFLAFLSGGSLTNSSLAPKFSSPLLGSWRFLPFHFGLSCRDGLFPLPLGWFFFRFLLCHYHLMILFEASFRLVRSSCVMFFTVHLRLLGPGPAFSALCVHWSWYFSCISSFTVAVQNLPPFFLSVRRHDQDKHKDGSKGHILIPFVLTVDLCCPNAASLSKVWIPAPAVLCFFLALVEAGCFAMVF